MNVQEIVRRVNMRLAGESLEYHELEPFLDNTIDDINAKLNSRYPAFSEFSNRTYPGWYPDYSFFPEEYIRKVVILGAAYYFYETDEEGQSASSMFYLGYNQALFEMLRDYVDHVPHQFSRNSFDPQHRIGGVSLHEDGMRPGDDRWVHPNHVEFRALTPGSYYPGWTGHGHMPPPSPTHPLGVGPTPFPFPFDGDW